MEGLYGVSDYTTAKERQGLPLGYQINPLQHQTIRALMLGGAA